jgi:hypothetical protein
MTSNFCLTRGLCQGDPLSPYLFILCQEVLSRIVDRNFERKKLSRAKMNVFGPAITYVMFADDLMLFAKANRKEVSILNECLDTYCMWSGQKINREKSGIIFSKLVSNYNRRWIKGELHMKKLPLDAFYLGTPVFSSRCKTKDFKYLIDRTEARLKGWRSKSLSWVGRRTLIKSIALALPTYSFSTASVPSSMCNKLDSTIRRFWWSPKKEQGRFLTWKAWEVLCCLLEWGGLGFRYLIRSNQAFLVKLVWLILSKKDSMCVNALQSKYKVGRDWKKKEALKYAYPFWKAIEGLRILISRGACYLIGDGSTIDFWKDPWIPWKDGFSPVPKNPSCVQENFKVADFIEASTKTWNRSGLAGIVDESSLEAILQVVILFLPRPNKLIWSLDLSGNFSVKSFIKSTLSPRVFS